MSQIDLRMPEMETHNWYDLLYRKEEEEKFKSVRWESVDEWTSRNLQNKKNKKKNTTTFCYDNGVLIKIL
jgi:hypothetical protein